MYGEIGYAKSWCGFFDPGMKDGTYISWRDQLTAYMTARNLGPGDLTNTQVDAITVFARSLSPVKECLTLIKQKDHADDVEKLSHRWRMLVKDSGRTLHTSNLRRMAERAGCKKVAESPSKGSSPSISRQAPTNSF